MGRKKSADLKRPGPKRNERYIIALFCEGVVTEPQYFNALRRLPEIRKITKLQLDFPLSGAVPLTLVERAIREKQENNADEYWCVFDVEWPKQHPNLLKAIDLAKRSGIRLAISNPAFEVWLLLHHKDHKSHLDTDIAIAERRKIDGSADKNLDPANYLNFRSVASARARALRSGHANNHICMPKDNPSTNVDELITEIEKVRS